MMLKRLYNIYYYPVLFVILILLIVATLISEYYFWSKNVSNSVDLAVFATIDFFVLSVSISVPLMIDRNIRVAEKKRLLMFSLGAIWNELRATKGQLINILGNFAQFKSIMQMNDTLEKLLDTVEIRVNSLYELYKLIEFVHYESMIANHSVSYLTDDNTYNTISNAYEDLVDSRSRFVLTIGAIKVRKHSLQILDTEEAVNLARPITLDETEKKIEELKKSLEFTKKSVEKAIKEIEKVLKNEGITSEEIVPNS